MRFFRYEICLEDASGVREITYGIVIGNSLGDAADKVANAFSNDVDHEVAYVKTELLAPDDDGVLILGKDLIDKIAEEVIW